MSSAPPWAPEITVSPDLASRLIDAQFPAIAPCTVEPLGCGWDNTAFLVNGELVFRFPRRQLGADCLAHELRVLPHIARRLPMPIPDPIHIGRANDLFPWPFAGYRYLPGQTACSVRLDDSQRSASAAPLATFLRALHSVSRDEVQSFGAPSDILGRLDPAKRVPLVEQRLADIHQLGLISDPASWHKVIAETAYVRPARELVLLHGDLYVRHILVDELHRPCGVIDWGDVHFGDPAVDLSIAHSFLPRAAQSAFREVYGPIDEPTWALARFRALQYGTYLVPYAHATGDQDLLREGLWILENVL
jgi:aminoglycoside phosphotransferase (APT) family kinase protein